MRWLRRLLAHGFARQELALPTAIPLYRVTLDDQAARGAALEQAQDDLRDRIDALHTELRILEHGDESERA